MTPEYNYSVPGGLKNAIDCYPVRLSSRRWRYKPVLIQTSSNGGDWRRALPVSSAPDSGVPDAMVMNKLEFMGGVIQNKSRSGQTGEVVIRGTLDHFGPAQLTAFMSIFSG